MLQGLGSLLQARFQLVLMTKCSKHTCELRLSLKKVIHFFWPLFSHWKCIGYRSQFLDYFPPKVIKFIHTSIAVQTKWVQKLCEDDQGIYFKTVLLLQTKMLM